MNEGEPGMFWRYLALLSNVQNIQHLSMDALVSLFELGGLLQGVKYGGISAEMVGEFMVTYFVDIFLAS